MTILQIEFGTPEYDEAVALRYEVLRKPLGLHYTPEQLAAEWDNIHIAAYDLRGKMVGYLNLTPLTEREVKMRQVAVAPSEQGKGIGSAMVQYSEALARKLNFEEINLHARETAIPFYLQLGYEKFGERFEEVGIPHFKMRKPIKS